MQPLKCSSHTLANGWLETHTPIYCYIHTVPTYLPCLTFASVLTLIILIHNPSVWIWFISPLPSQAYYYYYSYPLLPQTFRQFPSLLCSYDHFAHCPSCRELNGTIPVLKYKILAHMYPAGASMSP